MARIDTLSNFLTDVADSIREKTGDTANISPVDFDTEIASISTGYTPPTSTGFANDSWEVINELCEHGLASYYYRIGDTKTISTTNSTDNGGYYNQNWTARTITVKIVGMNHYPLTSDTTKYASLVLMVTDRDISLAGGSQYFGWAGASRMRNWVGNTFYNALPASLKSSIKQVQTKTLNGYSNVVVTIDEKIFLPAIYETGYNGPASTENAALYTLYLYGDAQLRTPLYSGTSNKFWLRGQGSGGTNTMAIIGSNGIGSSVTSYSNYIQPTFCI